VGTDREAGAHETSRTGEGEEEKRHCLLKLAKGDGRSYQIQGGSRLGNASKGSNCRRGGEGRGCPLKRGEGLRRKKQWTRITRADMETSKPYLAQCIDARSTLGKRSRGVKLTDKEECDWDQTCGRKKAVVCVPQREELNQKE